jgi:hypothetical protein
MTRRKRVAPVRSAAAVLATGTLMAGAVAIAVGGAAVAAPGSHGVHVIASTVPTNGDVNPYGVAVVAQSGGALVRGDVLVSNFNNSANAQGTGSTIMQVSPWGSARLFAQIPSSGLPGACPGGIGLTTALSVLRGGWVVVGSLPTDPMTGAFTGSGCLLVLNNVGTVVETITGPSINGPWDMTAFGSGSRASLFVTNVLNGTVGAAGGVVNGGTVVRVDLALGSSGPPRVLGTTTVASGYPERTDSAALVIGPTGVGLGAFGQLYVADTLDNRIDVVPDALFRNASAGEGLPIATGGDLNGPLGLVVAPSGDVLTVNSGDGNLVVTGPFGGRRATVQLDSSGSPAGAGALFGLALAPDHGGLYFVDDATNTLNLFHR